jgi:hypothetical protein
MPYKKLGEETLITKGTLTGIISRLAWRIKDSFNDLPRKRMDAVRLFAWLRRVMIYLNAPFQNICILLISYLIIILH